MIHQAKKSLGQNFLKSQGALRTIVTTGGIGPEDIILEIGPGKGALTEKILPLAGKVIAIEKDEALAEYLREKYADFVSRGKLDLATGDVLAFDPETLRVYAPHTYKILANIPYYLTGAILRMFLEASYQPAQMVLLVQKEVAERIVSRDGKESILSISVKAYGTPKYIEKVPKKYFSPIPKVDSAIINVSEISKKRFKNIEERAFFEVVRSGFAHKRKTLSNNLEFAGFDRETVTALLIELGIPSKERPENISVDLWFALAERIHAEKQIPGEHER